MNTFARNQGSGEPGSFRCRARWILRSVLMLGCLLCAANSGAQSFQDFFTNRETILIATGSLTGDNTSATVEPGEPKHGGKTGGHSLWISWVAPTNGVAKFETEGSGFDTLLSVYSFASTNDTTFDKLIEVARADDSEGFDHDSEVEFGVLMGQRYEIAVDGYFGATGFVELNWRLDGTPQPPPIIIGTPADRTVNPNSSVTLTYSLTNAAAGQYRWLFNGNELGPNTPTLSISSMQPTNVGRYKLQVRISGTSLTYFSMPVELQINSEGATSTFARDKLPDSPSSPLVGNDGSGPLRTAGLRTPSGVIRGYDGSQIFDTTYALSDPNEPLHCGVIGGSSYWLAYYPATNGTVTLDTIGSTYDTVMEAYTYNGTPTNYLNLISLACDNDSVAPQGASRISFPVFKTRPYVLVVDGVNGARGTAWLNYHLDTNAQPSAPKLLSQPDTQLAVAGGSATLTASFSGSPPLQYRWQKDQTLMPGFGSPSLSLTNLATTDSANYTLSVSNDLGGFAVVLPLRVIIPPRCDLAFSPGGLSLTWLSVTGQLYAIEQAAAITGPWVAWTNSFPGDGLTNTVEFAVTNTCFYRLRVR